MSDPTAQIRSSARRRGFSFVRQALLVVTSCRFAILSAALFVCLPLAAHWLAPSLMENALLIDNWQQAAVLTFTVLFTLAMLILQMRVTWFNFPDRIADWWLSVGAEQTEPRSLDDYVAASQRRAAGWPWWIWGVWLVMASPILASSFCLSVRDNGLSPWAVLVGCLVGFCLCLLVQLLATVLKYNTFPGAIPACGMFPFESVGASRRRMASTADEVSNQPRGLSVKAARWGLLRGPGYSFTDNEGVHRAVPGHWELVLLLILMVAIFVTLAFEGVRQDRRSVVPIFAHVSLMIALTSAILSGVAFWLDRYRVSTVAVVVVLSLILFLLPVPVARDYVFVVDRYDGDDSDMATAPSLMEAVAARDFPGTEPGQPNGTGAVGAETLLEK